MYFPIKIFTTEDSFLIINVTIPLWFSIRSGFKPDKIIARDRFFKPNILAMTGESKDCVHAYFVAWRFRIRSNVIMEKLDTTKNPKRMIFGFNKGWGQFFASAMI